LTDIELKLFDAEDLKFLKAGSVPDLICCSFFITDLIMLKLIRVKLKFLW